MAQLDRISRGRCAVYTRQSAETGSDFTSCDVQREICVAFGEAKSFEVLDERFDDHARPGSNLDRPAFQRLLTLVRGGELRAVVVHRLDRLSRRVADCASLMAEFKDLGVRLLVAAAPELADSASDTLLLNLMSCFAEFEREMIVSRIAEKRASLIARKRRIAGQTPFGYSADQAKQLVPVPDEATIVRELFQFVSAGMLPSEIEEIAAERGWRTLTGRPWTARQVLDTVSNPVYTGHFRAPGGTRPGVHSAIVSQDLFERCARITASRRTTPNGPRRRTVWTSLQGKVRCARCGQLMSIHVNHRGSVRYLTFRCRRAAAGEKACSGTQVRVFEIEQQVESVFRHPGERLPTKRGRPARAVVAIRVLGHVFPMLNPSAQQQIVALSVEEVIWDADSRRIRVSFNQAELLRFADRDRFSAGCLSVE